MKWEQCVVKLSVWYIKVLEFLSLHHSLCTWPPVYIAWPNNPCLADIDSPCSKYAAVVRPLWQGAVCPGADGRGPGGKDRHNCELLSPSKNHALCIKHWGTSWQKQHYYLFIYVLFLFIIFCKVVKFISWFLARVAFIERIVTLLPWCLFVCLSVSLGRACIMIIRCTLAQI